MFQKNFVLITVYSLLSFSISLQNVAISKVHPYQSRAGSLQLNPETKMINHVPMIDSNPEA